MKYKKRGGNVHEVQLCVVKHKKEVTMYMKYSSVVKPKKTGNNVHEVQLCVVKHKKEVTIYLKNSSVVKKKGDNVPEVQVCSET